MRSKGRATPRQTIYAFGLLLDLRSLLSHCYFWQTRYPWLFLLQGRLWFDLNHRIEVDENHHHYQIQKSFSPDNDEKDDEDDEDDDDDADSDADGFCCFLILSAFFFHIFQHLHQDDITTKI